MDSAGKEDNATRIFRNYLRIKTVQPNPDYDAAIDFLINLAKDVDLSTHVYQITPQHPLLVMTWKGTEPTLPSVVFNSHMDVVPVFEEHWKSDPFAAVKDEKGDIYARGTQDMKSVGIQYIEAIRKLKAKGFQPLRTIHLFYTPEEEVGSVHGMADFVHYQEFRDLNIGCILDEGLASPTDEFVVFNGQKVNYCVFITCKGNPGHGSQLIENTAGEKMRKVINQMMDLRESEKSKYEKNEARFSDIMVCNLTMLNGGVQPNVVPTELTACFDFRIPPTVDHDQTISFLNSVCEGDDVSYRFHYDPHPIPISSVDKSDPWWNALSSALETSKCAYRTEIFPAGTDSRYASRLGIQAYGFSPMNNTPILLHDHNEFLNEDVFLRGIDIYVQIISSMAVIKKF